MAKGQSSNGSHRGPASVGPQRQDRGPASAGPRRQAKLAAARGGMVWAAETAAWLERGVGNEVGEG